jgi:hypothetical protein
MVTVADLSELAVAVAARESEVLVTDEKLARRVMLQLSLRFAANVAAVVILVLAVFMWADPLHLYDAAAAPMLWVRRGVLGVGVLLLFADFLMPTARFYRSAGRDELGLKLRLRASR